MANLEIIGFPQSTYVRVARMACEEKGVAYDLWPAPPHSPEVLAIHPFGKIPAMRHGDFELFESKAIGTYLDRMFPGPHLIPEDARVEMDAKKAAGYFAAGDPPDTDRLANTKGRGL